MVSVTNADPERIAELLDEFAQDVRTVLPPVLSIRNGRRSVVITGTPEQLSRFELYCQQIAEKEEAERKNKVRGGAVFSPMFDPVQVEVGFHTPRLSDAIDMVGDWAKIVGLDVDLAREMAEAILVRRVDWVSEINDLHEAGARWILDLGPGDILTRLTAPVIRGLGVGIVPAATRGGQRNLFTVGAVPEVARPWTSYAPSLVSLPDGSVKLSTKFTRLTGRSPILLAGMTPTTVDAHIVAAAANAGHWSELAGGGQVTEEIFDNRIAELTSLLEPGRAVQFNSLFLDPYLWKLQVGGKRLVQKARQSGAPIDGVVVSAGIPELEEAVALIEELNDVGISHVVFKPGTVEQIRSVIRIAAEVPTKPVIVHIEGGRAGGHHSWEDLDDLLLATYSELRSRSNITVCVGGGIGTPERAAEYLSGRWAQAYGFPLMPVDGILVGTAAMATKESTTSPSVKQMLVEIGGTDKWISAGKAQGGMASSRSQLGADIHEIDNTASRCGRLLDEVAGDAEAVAARRDEIIAAMANTCKPYFGDVAEMTYAEWLQRYVDLTIGDGTSTADTASPGSPWLADTWRDRFADMLKRAEARLHPKDFGPIETLFNDQALLEKPEQAVAALLARYPDAKTLKLHPADVPFFVQLCKTLGKPVNFVPVIDKDVRRWWRSDSLWQAHDARYEADQVCIIPGTQSVAGITRVDEPVGDLLDRFEQASIDDVLASGGEAVSVVTRRQARADVTGPLAVVLDSPDVLWAGRTSINPVHRIGAPGEWQVNQNRSCHTPVHGCPAGTGGRFDGHAERSAVRYLDRDPVHSAVLHGRRRYARGHRRGRVERHAFGAGHRRRRRRTGEFACGAGQHRRSHRRVGPGEGRRPHRRDRDVRRAAGSRSEPGARRIGRPLLARGVRGDRLGRHRRGLPGRGGSAEPGPPGPCRAPAGSDAEDAGRIDRHRNGFGGHRHRVRPCGAGVGHHQGCRRRFAGHPRGAVRDPRPHGCRRADRSAARGRRDDRQRDRHAAASASRRHRHRTDRHERVRGRLR